MKDLQRLCFSSTGSINFQPSLKRFSSGGRSWTKLGRPGRLLGMQHERYCAACKIGVVGVVKWWWGGGGVRMVRESENVVSCPDYFSPSGKIVW